MTKQNIIDKIKDSGAVPEKKGKYSQFNESATFGFNTAIDQLDLSKIIDIVVGEVGKKINKKRLDYLSHTQMNFDEKCGWNKAMEIDDILQLLNNIK